MTIVVTGAGSGGHITPILAVAHELKRLNPDTKVVYIGQKGHSLSDIVHENSDINKTYSISAGKFRRYHSTGYKQIFDVSTNLKNLRDAWRVLIGTIHSFFILGRLKPDAIFISGYMGVPVGLSAALRHIPFITHDADAIPGLTNRILARWTTIHTTALPKEYYSYPPESTEMVGVPVSSSFSPVNVKQKADFRKEIGLEKYKKILLVTGGGQGAKTLNEVTLKLLPKLLEDHKDLAVLHFVGRTNEDEVRSRYDQELAGEPKSRVVVLTFVDDFYRYSGAADVVLSRAGATTMAEFATQGKACVIIPSPYLTGGHQLKNAQALGDKKAIVLITEEQANNNPNIVFDSIEGLLVSDAARKELAEHISKFAVTNSAKKLATLLTDLSSRK